MVTSPYEWKFSSGTTNPKTDKQLNKQTNKQSIDINICKKVLQKMYV